MPRSLGRTGRRWRNARAALFATRPDICVICGHFGGTTDAHHDPPLKTLEALGLDPCDLRFLHRAHGVGGCPVCNKKCNQAQGDKPTQATPHVHRAW